MKQEDKVFAIGISALFVAIILTLIETGYLLDPVKFSWVTTQLQNLIILGLTFSVTLSIGMFIKFLKIPD
jgi:phosphoglycerol transferase MdoB-like AlkP superfamily enzyme